MLHQNLLDLYPIMLLQREKYEYLKILRYRRTPKTAFLSYFRENELLKRAIMLLSSHFHIELVYWLQWS